MDFLRESLTKIGMFQQANLLRGLLVNFRTGQLSLYFLPLSLFLSSLISSPLLHQERRAGGKRERWSITEGLWEEHAAGGCRWRRWLGRMGARVSIFSFFLAIFLLHAGGLIWSPTKIDFRAWLCPFKKIPIFTAISMQMDHLAVCKNMLWPFANIIYVVVHEVRPHTYLLYSFSRMVHSIGILKE